jgi:3-dehydroquinate dehydratase
VKVRTRLAAISGRSHLDVLEGRLDVLADDVREDAEVNRRTADDLAELERVVADLARRTRTEGGRPWPRD